jgi:hypothetical protein
MSYYYYAAPFEITHRYATLVSDSCTYSLTQDTNDTMLSIVVVLSAPALVLRYNSRKMREVPPIVLKHPMPRNVKLNLRTSGLGKVPIATPSVLGSVILD